jgi:hypothetical protein
MAEHQRISTFLAGILRYFIAQEISATVCTVLSCHNNINNKVVERAGIGHKLTFGVVFALACMEIVAHAKKNTTQKGGEITLNK